MRWTRKLTPILVVAAACGCAAKPPAPALGEGARMIDLYRKARAPAQASLSVVAAAPEVRCRWWLFTWPCGTEGAAPDARPAPGPSYTRTAANELELLFVRLPNPDIYIYVPPHLATKERIPVPGYTTAVPLYERVEYALPGESAEDRAEASP